MRIAIGLLVILGAACGGGGDDGDEVATAATPCIRLRDHVVELRLQTAHGTPQQLNDMREAFNRALGPEFFTSCEKNLSSAEIDCSLQASDQAALKRCAPARKDGQP